MIGQKENCWYNTYKELLVLQIRHQSMKQGSLFCYVQIFQTKTCRALGIFGKLSMSIWVHWLRLRLFGALLWNLLIIEPFFLSQWKINKFWNWKLYWNLGSFLVLLESSRQVRFNRVYFTIFRAKVWKMLIFEWSLLQEIPTNCKKNGFGKKNQLSSQYVLHCQI